MDYILKEMKKLNADGVDFIPLHAVLAQEAQNNYSLTEIKASYSKNEWIKGVGIYPKTPYRFWKMIDGKKEYV